MFNLKDGEAVEQEIRRHWFVMLPPVIGAALALALPLLLLLLAVVAGRLFDQLEPLEVSVGLLALLVAAYLLWATLVIVYLFITWTEYYLDVWYITNQRLIDVDQESLFKRNTKSLRYERIQDVTVEVHGILATLLKFGTVHVQTAGTARQIDIRQVKQPYQLRKSILEHHDKATARYYQMHHDKENVNAPDVEVQKDEHREEEKEDRRDEKDPPLAYGGTPDGL